MSQADRPECDPQKIDQVAHARNIFEQRMRIDFNRLMAEERRLLKEKTEK